MSERVDVSVQPMSIEEAQRFMEGDQTMDGGRHDLATRGLSSDDPTFFHQQLPDPAPEAPYVQQPGAQGQNWQALYGREANEKGTWRRTAEEALNQLELAKAELALLRTGAPQASQQAGNYSQVAPQIQQQVQRQVPTIPERFFPERDLNDAVLVEDVEKMLKNMVAPEILNLRAQQEAVQAAQLQAARATSGISPAVEFHLVQNNPWLNAIGDPYARLAAMQSLIPKQTEQSAPEARKAAPVNSGNAAVRRLTMVESMTPRTSEADMDSNEIMRREMAAAMGKPFGAERTNAMREVFNKYGVQNVNDFGPGVLTR